MDNNIPVVIFCGGQGTRMRGGTTTKKELVKVGGRPIIWHVMRIFSAHGCDRFILTLGYEADQMRRYFLSYNEMSRNLTLTMGDGDQGVHFHDDLTHPDWDVSLIDTGLLTEKAQRVAKVADYIDADRFFLAYGDDVSDVDLTALIDFHKAHGKLATLTAVRVTLPYGVVEADAAGAVNGFVERPELPYWINGGFMLFERDVISLCEQHDDLEREVLPKLAEMGELMIYRHDGFWQSMNTLKDTMVLEQRWQTDAPWRVWQ